MMLRYAASINLSVVSMELDAPPTALINDARINDLLSGKRNDRFGMIIFAIFQSKSVR